MKYLTTFGRILFGIALVGLGLTHFIFGEFNTGRAPAWPETTPGGLIWIYLSGAVFISAGIAILSGKKARSAAILAAALVLFYALLRHIPVIALSSFLSGEWTDAAKALRFTAGAMVVAAVMPKVNTGGSAVLFKFMNLKEEFILAGRVCVGLTLILNGAQHFIFVEFVASLIPTWFPGSALFWTWFGGITLISGGIGLLIPKIARLAALLSGMMIFSWFFIIHLSREIAGVADGIAVFEALLTAGILFVIAGYLYQQKTEETQL